MDAAGAAGSCCPPWRAPCAALAARRVVVWYRHTTVAARILALFVAFLVPALLLYPSVDYFAETAMRSLIATQYAVQAQKHSETLQERLTEARREIDALTVLPLLVADGSPPATPRAEAHARRAGRGDAATRVLRLERRRRWRARG